jgi:hypothetical protein
MPGWRPRRSGCLGLPGRGTGQAAGLMAGQAALCLAHARQLREMGLEIVKGLKWDHPSVGVFPDIADHLEHDRSDGAPTCQEGYLRHRRTTPLPAQSSSSLLPYRAPAADSEGRRRTGWAGAAACGAGIVQDYSCRGCPRGPIPFVGRVSAGTTCTNGRSTHESVPVVHLRRGG